MEHGSEENTEVLTGAQILREFDREQLTPEPKSNWKMLVGLFLTASIVVGFGGYCIGSYERSKQEAVTSNATPKQSAQVKDVKTVFASQSTHVLPAPERSDPSFPDSMHGMNFHAIHGFMEMQDDAQEEQEDGE